MQDLFFLKQRFSTIADKYAWSADDRRQIKSIINFVEMINVGLRQSCFDLHPYLLKECGLVQTVDLFVEKESVDSPFAIDFAAEHIDAIEALELGAKTHLFRIVQELLNNARKHSQATAVRLRLDVAESYCRLSYEDDGVGFAEPDVDAAAEAAKGIRLSGQGLAQMKTRVLHVNGRFELSSAEQSGMRLDIWIPMREVVTL
uniref:histidine kinase n=2 Tax=Paenibacillus athensensis TaxID=1967502 RepID=A0A4Y8PPC1_9BACL